MAEMIVVKYDDGSKEVTVICPSCARISHQILKAPFNNGSNNKLLTAHTCPVCGAVYHFCNSFGADAWNTAYSVYLLNPDAYNTVVKENNTQRRQAEEDAKIKTEYTEEAGDNNYQNDNQETSASSEPADEVNVPPKTEMERKIERWKRELLDTGKRNKMINYRETKRQTLKILEPEATELFNLLAVSEKTLTFQRPISKDSDFRTYSVLALLETLSYSLPVQVGDIKAEGTVMEREKTLKNLRSKAKIAQEEQGTNILYLSFGFILWREHNRESSPWLKSPLLMMPVQLNLKSLNAPYTLSKYDDEIEVNPTLDYLFNQNYGIDLPSFELKNKDSFEIYLEQIEEIIDKKGWKLIREVSLGLLSFLKISMYHDLNNNREQMLNNPIIQAISGDRNALGELPEEARNFNFDKTQPTDWHEVVDSDSSQEEAILLSKLGVSFVMQGPPGTGKSQTITNIIAEALGDGKKVLFVSEKSAALQVVLKRLTEAKLDDFCLSLHNYKANKKEIIDNIGENLSLSQEFDDSSVMGELTELFHDRQYLDRYAEELHKKIEPFGESVYKVFGRLAKLSDVSAIEFKLRNPTNISKEEFASLLYLVDAFEKALNAMEYALTENPWANTTATSSGQIFKTEMMNATDGLARSLSEIEGLIAFLNKNYFCQLNPTWNDIQAHIGEYEEVFTLPLFPLDWRKQERRETLRSRALIEEKKRTNAREHTDIVRLLIEKINAEWDFYGITLSREDLSEITFRKGYQESAKEGQTATEYNAEVISFLDWTQETTEEILRDYHEAAALLGLPVGDTFSDIETVSRILKMLQKAPAVDEDWFDLQKNPELIEQAEEAGRHQNVYMQNRAAVLENWESSVLTIDADEMIARFRTLYTSEFYRKKENVDKDLDRLRVMYKSVGAYIEDAEIIDMLQSLMDINAEKRWFLENESQIRNVVPILYRGEDTDWDYVVISIQNLAGEAKEHQTKLRQLTEQVLSAWETGILNIDSVGMLNRFKTEYVGLFHKMKATYKEDIRQMRLLSKSVGKQIEDGEIINVLQLLNEIKAEKQWFLDNAQQFQTQIPAYYRAEDTDWELVEREASNISKEAQKHQAVIKEKTGRILEKWEASVFETDPVEILMRFRQEYTENYRISSNLYKEDIIYLMRYSKHIGERVSSSAAIELLTAVSEAKREEGWYQRNDSRLREIYKNNYFGIETNWKKVVAGISIARDVAAQFPEGVVPGETIRSIQGILESSDKTSDVIRLSESLEEEKLRECISDVQKAIGTSDLPMHISFEAIILPGIWKVKDQEEKIRSFLSVLTKASRNGSVTYQNIKKLEGFLDDLYEELNWFIRNTTQFDETRDEISRRSIDQQMVFAEGIVRRYAGETKYVLSEDLAALFDSRYSGLETDWQQIIKDIDAVSAFENKSLAAGVQGLVKVVSNDTDKRTEAEQCFDKIRGLMERNEKGLNYFDQLFPSADMKNSVFHDVSKKYDICMNGFGDLNKWLDFVETKEECDANGLEDFTSKIVKRNNSVRDVRKAFERGFYMQWLSLAIADVPSVQIFRRRVHEQRLSKFIQLDEKQFEISRQRIRDSVIRTFPNRNSMTSARSELGILRHEMEKKRRIMPLRRLFHEIPTLLLTLKPCLMMSPLSVAYFLNAEDYHFDMVIFDEASQIFPQDAIGAIFRADQVIIAGDTKQLPPTDFFSANTSNSLDDYDDDDEDKYEDEIYDSILEETANVLPNRTLLWHYRSKHEHLIAFSNKEIYRNELVTFPSNNESEPDTGVEFVFVEDGYYESKGKNRNIPEAKQCVELVRDHIEKYPDRSLGIIAFSEKQQQAISQEIQRFREENPQYEEFFAEDKEDEFFVKNLENVQGDERDTIFFSIGYAKTKEQKASGKPMAMRFGPLGKSGGERRLNVAVTRAKKNVKLVSSILPSDIDLSRTESDGIRMLRSYIEFAMNGGAALASANQNSMPDDFVNAVQKYLTDKGFKVRKHVGCSGYKIDLAVEHPEIPDEFVAGVECDGLSYASAKTARDRDRLRGSVLRNMGWNLYRVWSAEWYRNPEIEGQKLQQFLQSAIAGANERIKVFRAQKEAEERARQAEAEKERIAKEQEEQRRKLEEQRIAEAAKAKEKQAAEKRRRADEIQRQEELERREKERLKTKNEAEDGVLYQRNLFEYFDSLEKERQIQQEQRTVKKQFEWVKPEVKVEHAGFGIGIIKRIENKTITVTFSSGDKRFVMPDAFIKGFLKKAESASSRTVKNKLPGSNTKNNENSSKDELYRELIAAGFTCIDNREFSNIIWVLYRADKKEQFDQIAIKYKAHYKFEKRGAMATDGRAAWRIMT